MLVKIPVLFILSLIISFSICTECATSEGENGSPKNDGCFDILLPNEYCCFNSEDGKCKPVEKGKLKDESSKNIICQISEENFGKYEFDQYHPKQDFDGELGFQTCGKYNPKKRNDCTDYSEISNSCCYFKNSKG